MPAPGNTVIRSKPVWIIFAVVALFNLLVGVIAVFRADSERNSEPLLVHCASDLQTVMTAIVKDYERETGTRVELSFGDSSALLTNMLVSRRGDLFLPSDGSYLSAAQKNNLLKSVYPLAVQRPAIVAPEENSKSARAEMAVGVLTSSAQIETAEKFARYVASPTNGLRHFQSNGFQVLATRPEFNHAQQRDDYKSVDR